MRKSFLARTLGCAGGLGLLLPCFVPTLCAQAVDGEDESLPNEFFDYPLPDHTFVPLQKNAFSVSLRFLGTANVTFSNLGTIESDFDTEDMTTLMDRYYDDGYVFLDGRGLSGTASELSDGRTNTWAFYGSDQISDDGSSILMHDYSAVANDTLLTSDSEQAVNPDLEYSRLLWQFGRPVNASRRQWQVGWLGGWGMSDVKASVRGSTTADLVVLTDTYSLNGAPVPTVFDDDGVLEEGYSAPSTKTVYIEDPDGSLTTYAVDDTTLLASLPLSRTIETFDNTAEIEGYWDVSGAYFTLRTGPWVRWEPKENFAFKLSAGGTMTLIGLNMHYEETLVIDEDTESALVSNESEYVTHTSTGIFGAFDAEWLVNGRTSFFASAYYEDYSEELNLEIDDRRANAEVSSGLGLRFGITTRF